MRLRRVEIEGFKSFRDRVVLDFPHGICGIIGPNGCGKSNIVDAVRWVMGEQRVKALRGKKMDDVIFNGSEGSAPLGMAEVTMTFESNGRPFPGAYADCAELTVTRKIFRDGDSEYYLNRVPCRLLDVKEFFMGTGIGTRTYSLVEQNSVSTLVEAKPEERRHFIEEAAGISKYKSRKEAATRKMEATSQNILRLNDILREVKSRLNAVSRQARRAEQYKELKKNIREAELTVALQGYGDLAEEKKTLDGRQTELKDRETQIRTNLRELAAALEGAKLAALENERLVAEGQEKLYAVKNTIGIKEQGIEFSRGKIADTGTTRQRDLAEIEALEKRAGDIEREIEALKAAEAESEGRIGEVRAAVTALQAEVEELRRTDKALEQELEEKKVVYFDVVTQKSNLKNMVAGLARNMEYIRTREEKDTREAEEHRRRCDALGETLAEIARGLETDAGRYAELKGRREDVAGELERARADLSDRDEEIAGLKEEAGKKSARFQSLHEFHQGYGWCSDGIKSLLSPRGEECVEDGNGVPEREVFAGLVADHIRVPQEYEVAVESVLGEKLRYVVVRSQEDGVKAIDYLKRASLGRGSFVPMAVRTHAQEIAAIPYLQEAVRLIDKVNVDEDYRAIAEYLLGDVLLIPTLPNGISLWQQNGFTGTFVTPEGDIVSPHGVLTGGSTGNGEGNLLRSKREAAELEEELGRLATRLEEASGERKQIAGRIAEWTEELQQLGGEVHRLEIQTTAKRKDIERFEDERRRVTQRISVLDLNRENMLSETKDAEERTARIGEEIAACEVREKALSEEMALLQERRKALGSDLEAREGRLTGEKVLLASLEERRGADLKTRERLESDRAGISRETAARQEDIAACDRQVEELTALMAAEREQLGLLYAEYQAGETVLGEKKALQEEVAAKCRAIEEKEQEARRRLDEAVRELNEGEMSCRQTALQMENLRAGIGEKHHVDLEALSPQFQRLEDAAIQELVARLEANRQSIENFGEVNLLALEEHDQLKERFDFLTKQIADLNTSLAALEQTIARINRISRKRFADTFEAVSQSFREMFTRIFPGGRGELRLTDENDLLETGVDIDIQIPGKRAQSVSLLSGGEKSLAAIALIFAILAYRPSPFLVLDEVDAALDDRNIALFNGLLQDISANSQIIMVTHNKRSMEVAGSLFGITMQEQGVSTMVAVNLN